MEVISNIMRYPIIVIPFGIGATAIGAFGFVWFITLKLLLIDDKSTINNTDNLIDASTDEDANDTIEDTNDTITDEDANDTIIRQESCEKNINIESAYKPSKWVNIAINLGIYSSAIAFISWLVCVISMLILGIGNIII